jgi:hypothetical protein
VPAIRSATAYILGGTLEQRQGTEMMVQELLTGLDLLSDTAVVHVKKSTHLYVVDDLMLSGEPGPDKPAELEFEPLYWVLKPQWRQAEELAETILLGLDRIFAKPHAGWPAFLWPRATRKFSRSAPGRLVSGGKPHHWFLLYELLMEVEGGHFNGIRGAFVELRLLPLAGGGWRLMLLHVRFPLLAEPVKTKLYPLPGPAGGSKEERKGQTKPKTLLWTAVPSIPPIGPLLVDAGPEEEGHEHEHGPGSEGHAHAASAADPPLATLRYVLPVEGSNLLAPYYAFAGEEDEQFAPATPESAIILIERKPTPGLLVLKAAVAPAAFAGWTFAWHHSGIEAGRRNRPSGGLATGPALVLPEGLFDIDLHVTRTVRIGEGRAARDVPLLLRTRRMISSAHAVGPIAPEAAEAIVHSHGGAGGGSPPHTHA